MLDHHHLHMLYVHILWRIVLFILMQKIHQVDVLLKNIHAKNAKNADIEQMQFFKVHTHMLNVLIDIN